MCAVSTHAVKCVRRMINVYVQRLYIIEDKIMQRVDGNEVVSNHSLLFPRWEWLWRWRPQLWNYRCKQLHP